MMTESPRVLVAFGGIPLHGQERANIQVIRALREHDHEALFVTHREYGYESIEPELDRLGLHWTPGTYPLRWRRGMSLRDVARQIADSVRLNVEFIRAARRFKPTHIHMVSERYLTDLLPALWWLRKPVVFRIGDVPRQHRWMLRTLWKRVYTATVTSFVGNSKFVCERLREAGVPASKLRMIYSTPPDRPEIEMSDLPEDLQRELASDGTTYPGRTCVYVGQLSEEKGVGHVVEAALTLCRQRDDVRFLIAGDYTWQNPFAEGLMERVQTEGFGDRIRFLGYTQDIPGLLELADVQMAPSICEEALANTVLEAKRARVPSVVFPSGGLPEIVHTQGVDAYLCAAKTDESLTEGIAHYLDLDSDALAKAGEAARRSLHILGFTPDAFSQSWADVYATS